MYVVSEVIRRDGEDIVYFNPSAQDGDDDEA